MTTKSHRPGTSRASVEVERLVLAGCLAYPAGLVLASTLVRPEDFWVPTHAVLFRALLAVAAKGQALEPALVLEAQRAQGVREATVVSLDVLRFARPASLKAVEDAARTVRECAVARRIEDAGRALVALAQDVSVSAGEVPSRAITLLDAALAHRELTVASSLAEIAEAADEPVAPALRMGLQEFDDARWLGGVRNGQLMLIAARPGVGKTALAGTVLFQMVRAGVSAVFFSLEMTKREIYHRMLAGHLDLPTAEIRDPAETTRAAILAANNELSKYSLWIDDDARVTARDIRARALYHNAKRKIDLVVVDYVQRIRPEDAGSKYRNREQEVATAARELKSLAKDLNVPVIALAQINRDSEKRADKRPTLADLRESGALEAEADVVILLHRERTDLAGTVVEAIIAKQRDGWTGTRLLDYQGYCTRFGNLSADMDNDYRVNVLKESGTHSAQSSYADRTGGGGSNVVSLTQRRYLDPGDE